MSSPSHYHVIIYAPLDAADAIRTALANAGAGAIGDYDSCSFSSRGTGRFRPLKEADPHIGSVETLEEVEEERIEVVVATDNIKSVLESVIAVHPYEEPAIHVLPMVDYRTLLQG